MKPSKFHQIINSPTKEATVADIPQSNLEEVLTGIGYPPGSVSVVPKEIRLTRKDLEDFGSGAAHECEHS